MLTGASSIRVSKDGTHIAIDPELIKRIESLEVKMMLVLQELKFITVSDNIAPLELPCPHNKIFFCQICYDALPEETKRKIG